MLCLRYARIMLLYLMDEMTLADEERLKIDPSRDFLSTFFAKYLNYFYCGMICLGLARLKRRRYLRQANRYISKIKALASSGSVNCVHMLTLLQAEKSSLQNKPAYAEFDRAISMAGKSGFRIIMAIGLERAGVHAQDRGDRAQAKDYLQRSYDEFLEYGAVVKLEQMRRKYGPIFMTKKTAGSAHRLRPHVVKPWEETVQ